MVFFTAVGKPATALKVSPENLDMKPSLPASTCTELEPHAAAKLLS